VTDHSDIRARKALARGRRVPGRLLASLAVLAPVSAGAAPAGQPAEGPARVAPKDMSSGKSTDPWIVRHRPRRNTLELGVAVGVFLPSAAHELYDYTKSWAPYRPAAASVVLRAGFYPLAALGVEAEGAFVPTQTVMLDRALIYGARAHVVGQLPLASVVPFALVGGGALGTTGAGLGRDIDPSFHFGGGLKIFVDRWFGVRLDARGHVGTAFMREAYRTVHPEVLATLVVALGGKLRDSDRDGVPDPHQRARPEDACPREPGVRALAGCPDGDRDGLRDLDDACPRQPGPAARDGCPDLVDGDGDGYFDPDQYELPDGLTDRCPQQPGVEAYDGCPAPDTDGDGLDDLRDACDDEPETVNGFKDDDGCPDRVPPDVAKILGTIRGIHFAFLSADLSASSKPILERAAAILAEYPELKLEIQGHTDSDGDPAFNKDLSLRRAETVRGELIYDGVAADRLQSVGYGGERPVASNATEEGRAANRRIEFRLLGADGQPLAIPGEPAAPK
jgi:OOP family OmpA-OmpF porin